MKRNGYREFAKHVVKFADGSYLSPNLKYESRVTRQFHAQRWLTWACAKMIADSKRFEGKGARAVHLKEVKVNQAVAKLRLRVIDAKVMTDAEIASELETLGKKWDEFRASDDEGHGGSPGEWMVERMGELETEQKRRKTKCIHGSPACDDCIAHDTMLHMST
jgi:hypothetical protein